MPELQLHGAHRQIIICTTLALYYCTVTKGHASSRITELLNLCILNPCTPGKQPMIYIAVHSLCCALCYILELLEFFYFCTKFKEL